MGRFIGVPLQYDSEWFSSLPVDLQDPQKYYKSIVSLFDEIKRQFPLLRICILPSNKPKTAFIQGLLLPLYVIKEKYLDIEQYLEFGLPIFAVIPENYQTIGIRVYDACKRILWDNIPVEYRHCIPLNANTNDAKRGRYICTHNSKDITTDNCVIPILKSAYFLFEEYRKYERTGRFDLSCLPHGECKER